MQKLAENVYTDTTIRGCNPSIVLTSEGAVFIDSAQWLTTLLEMREFALSYGPIKYLINTEGHIDHIFGNHWFAEDSLIIGHERLHEIFWTVAGDLDCYDYSVDVLERQDKAGLKYMPSREEFNPKYPDITFNDRLTFKLGETTFELYHTPGHTDSSITIYLPKEKIMFASDTLFVECQTWLHSADIDALLKTLDFLETFDAEQIVPGHGPVVGKEYILKQKLVVYDWLSAVAKGISAGWDLNECIERISFADRWPVDIGQAESMEYIQETNVRKCFDYFMKNKK